MKGATTHLLNQRSTKQSTRATPSVSSAICAAETLCHGLATLAAAGKQDRLHWDEVDHEFLQLLMHIDLAFHTLPVNLKSSSPSSSSAPCLRAALRQDS